MTGRESWVNPHNFTTVQKHLAPGQTLDIGAGDAHPHADVTVDVDEDTEPDVVADLSRGIPFADNSFANVSAIHVIEHLPDDVGLWHEMQRVARDRAIAVVPVGTRDDPDHEHVYDRADIQERFAPDHLDLSNYGALFDAVLITEVT